MREEGARRRNERERERREREEGGRGGRPEVEGLETDQFMDNGRNLAELVVSQVQHRQRRQTPQLICQQNKTHITPAVNCPPHPHGALSPDVPHLVAKLAICYKM